MIAQQTNGMKLSLKWMDYCGAGLSLACAVHCIGMTVLMLALPALWLKPSLFGIPLESLHEAEGVLAFLALAVATIALGHGWLRHRRPMPPVLGLTGMTLICSGLLVSSEGESLASTLLVFCGGLTLATAHWLNLPQKPRSLEQC